ncbi:hypothetical protein PLEOSDRAFT_1088869 [Pleurotus ostreatus PC15]|uniref:glutaminase n=1 Tax=Pleurotus ostreatus (strain PC15) TaxID=1137138 RepID=A0A067NLD0_PLEO1|nr:hypothetical protein PLEOSDRAFT_1088869 [Pleurotus ostreatus PC15]
MHLATDMHGSFGGGDISSILPDEVEVTIGILALQGAFIEHEHALQRLFMAPSFLRQRKGINWKFSTVQVRSTEDLERCSALIIPGGESTTIALLLRLSSLLEPLRAFSATKPIWGTCAGAILLAKEIANPKKGGQEVLGQVSVRIERNGWGSQVESFEAPLEVPKLRNPDEPFTGVFIRAPVILSLLDDKDAPIEEIARIPEDLLPAESCDTNTNKEDRHAQALVALRQGNHFLTTFHPELTEDDRFHEFFVVECVLDYVLKARGKQRL